MPPRAVSVVALALFLTACCDASVCAGKSRGGSRRGAGTATAGGTATGGSSDQPGGGANGGKGGGVAVRPPPLPPPVMPTVPPATPGRPPSDPPKVAQGTADRAKVKQWARTVALGSEFGRDREIATRFTRPVRFSVMRGDQAVRQDMLDLIPTLNEALAPAGAPIRVVADGTANAEITVYFAPLADFDGIARAQGFTYVKGNFGYFHIFWNARREITRSVVLMATDKLSGASLRHFSNEELTQALGLANDSPAFPDSVFYANGSDGGSASRPSALDRKLLSFLYTHVKPGDDRRAFEAKFDAHWQ